jgi:hypothetical protein
VHHVADEESLILAAQKPKHDLTRRVPRRWLDQEVVAELVGHADDVILLRGDHWQNGVSEDIARLLRQVRIVRRIPEVQLVVRKEYFAFGKVGTQRPSSILEIWAQLIASDPVANEP